MIVRYTSGSLRRVKATDTNKMAREIEIKLRVVDRRAFQRTLKRLGARRLGRVYEWNVLFDTPQKDLRKREQLVRVRTETPPGVPLPLRKPQTAILSFKAEPQSAKGRTQGKGQRHKVREEIEVQVADAAALCAILEGLGMSIWFRYEKYRTTFRLPASRPWARGLKIELDETPIGTFVELEGARLAIDRAAKALGYSLKDYIVANYFVLYRDACRRAGKKAGDILFSRDRPAHGAR